SAGSVPSLLPPPSSFRGVRPIRGLNAELLCVFGVQLLPASEFHGLGTDHASNRPIGEKAIENIQTNVPPGSTHRDKAAINAGPQRQARAAANGFEFPPHIVPTPAVLEHPGSIGP